MENTLDVRGGDSSTYDQDLFDPVLVLQTRVPLIPSRMDGLSLYLPVSLGAWLGDSDLVYDVEAQLQYAFDESWDLRVGYRILGYAFEKNDDNERDFAMAGWTVGLGFWF